MSTAGLAFTDPDNHVQNDVWSKVDAYSLEHLHSKTKPNTDALRHALINSNEHGLPDIASSPTMAKFMALHCKAKCAKHALEVGVLGGYGSLWLATENPGLKITGIEIEPLHKEVSEQNFKYAGVEDRVTVRLGAGLEVIPQLEAEIKQGLLPKFDFVYLDADKSNNWSYIDLLTPLCESGAAIFVDNMLQQGELVNPDTKSPSAIGARTVVERVGTDDRLDAILMQMVGEKTYDAFLMAVIR